MARPIKQGVDYFSHDTVSGKTLFTIESRFGNDGYAFWFKLLEILGTQAGLHYSCENPADWMFLVAKTRVSEEIATEILNTLASLDAIDAELWRDHKVIWVQKFVDRLEDVFKKRTAETPQKPSFRTENTVKTDVYDAKSTQSKVNKIKVNETIKKDAPAHGGDQQPESDIYEGRSFSPIMKTKLDEWLKYKKERRDSYKPTGLNAFFTQVENKLKTYPESAIVALIDECMANNWQGVIWDKLKNKEPPNPSNPKREAWERPVEPGKYDRLYFDPFAEETKI